MFVTLVSIQPAVAVHTGIRQAVLTVPQMTDNEQAGGIFDAKRQNQLSHGKISPPGAK